MGCLLVPPVPPSPTARFLTAGMSSTSDRLLVPPCPGARADSGVTIAIAIWTMDSTRRCKGSQSEETVCWQS